MLDPARPREVLLELRVGAARDPRPRASKTRQVVPVVPWSIARIIPAQNPNIVRPNEPSSGTDGPTWISSCWVVEHGAPDHRADLPAAVERPAEDGRRGGRPPPTRPARGSDGRGGRPPRLLGHDPARTGQPGAASPRAPSTSTSRASRTASCATFDDIVDEVDAAGRRGASTSRATSGERLLAGLAAFMALAAEEEAAAYLATVESLTLGAAAVPTSRAGGAALRRADPAELRPGRPPRPSCRI